jgi:hypothetical protein
MRPVSELHGLLVARFRELSRAPRDFYVVGGAVRDLLLGEQPVDVDLAGKNAEPRAAEFAQATRGRMLELGREPLQVWRIFTGGRIYDFAELHGGSIASDLARRDFTIDALAYRMDEHRLIDPTGGVRDLERGVIRMISEQNLLDDPLRMVKAVRMAARFGFAIEPETAEAIGRHASEIRSVAPERITYEIDGILDSGRARAGFELLSTLGFDLFGGPAAPASDAADPEVNLALLLRDRRPEEIERLGRRWRWSTRRMRTVAALLRARDDLRPLEIAIFDAGPALAPRIAAYLEAAGDERWRQFAAVLKRDGERIFTTRPMLNGREIAQAAGVAEGPALGALKRRLLEAQLLGEVTSRGEARRFLLAAAEGKAERR